MQLISLIIDPLIVDPTVPMINIMPHTCLSSYWRKLRLALHDNALHTNRKSGVAFPLFILRLDERLWVEICVRAVMQKCVKFDVVCTPGG